MINELKISVIIPVYNTQDYLRECLDSIILQSLKEIEIIAIDDCSCDNSLEILKEYALKDSRVKVIALKERQSTGVVRNGGLDVAQGEFVAFMDADDLYASPDVLEKLYQTAKENKVDAAAGNMALFDKNDIKSLRMYGEKDWNFYEAEIKDFADYVYTYGYTRFIYKRETIENFKVRFPDCIRREDPVFFQEIMLKIGKFATIPEIVYAYRINHKEVVWSDAMLLDAITAYQKQIEMTEHYGLDKHKNKLMDDFVADIKAIYFEELSGRKIKKVLVPQIKAILRVGKINYDVLWWQHHLIKIINRIGIKWGRHEKYIRIKIWFLSFKIKNKK